MGSGKDHRRFPHQYRFTAGYFRKMITGFRKFLEFDLVVGQLFFIVHNGKDILLSHVSRGNNLFDERYKTDRIAFRKDADKIKRFAGTRFFTAPEHPEIMRACLHNIPPFPQIAVYQKTAKETGLVSKHRKQSVERVPGKLDLLAVEEIERLLIREFHSTCF